MILEIISDLILITGVAFVVYALAGGIVNAWYRIRAKAKGQKNGNRPKIP